MRYLTVGVHAAETSALHPIEKRLAEESAIQQEAIHLEREVRYGVTLYSLWYRCGNPTEWKRLTVNLELGDESLSVVVSVQIMELSTVVTVPERSDRETSQADPEMFPQNCWGFSWSAFRTHVFRSHGGGHRQSSVRCRPPLRHPRESPFWGCCSTLPRRRPEESPVAVSSASA